MSNTPPKQGETIVAVPASAIISVDCKPLRTQFPLRASVQGRLAAYLASLFHREASDYRPWQDVWPTQESLSTILPIYWPARLQELLPPEAKGRPATPPTSPFALGCFDRRVLLPLTAVSSSWCPA